MSDVCRRGFFKVAAGLAGAVVTAPALLAGQESSKGACFAYSRKKIASVAALKKDGEMDFFYPDADSPCKAILVNGEVKAYSVLCTHKGCPTIYDASKQIFACPCHFSKFDAEKDGQMIIGQATATLPQILVEVKGDDVIAYGVNGLIYGRLSNVL